MTTPPRLAPPCWRSTLPPPRSSASPAATSRSRAFPRSPQALIQRMRRYQYARSASFAGWTPDGGLTVTTRFGNTSQLHVVDMPMGARRQITFFDEPMNGGSWSPTGARKGVVYIRDSGGDENYQLEYLDPASANPVRLTDGRGRADTGVWSQDGTQLRIPVDGDAPASQPTSTSTIRSTAWRRVGLRGAEVGWDVADWSPDGKSLLIDPLRVGQRELLSAPTTSRPPEKQEIEPSKVKAAARRQFLARRQGRVLHVRSRQRVPHAALRGPRDGQGRRRSPIT